jgi:hypothetical protein
LAILLAAAGGAVLIDNLTAYRADGFAVFVGLAKILTSIAIYVCKLHPRPGEPAGTTRS